MNIKTVEQIPRLEPEEENVMQSIVCINYLKLDFWRILEGFILGLKGFLEMLEATNDGYSEDESEEKERKFTNDLPLTCKPVPLEDVL